MNCLIKKKKIIFFAEKNISYTVSETAYIIFYILWGW